MLSGGEKAISLSLKMVVIYAVWLGIFGIAEKTGITTKLAKKLTPLNRRLFGDIPTDANGFISLNLSANALGIGGATTPTGIKAVKLLSAEKNGEYATALFFVLNATSVQLIPSSIIALRSSYCAANPSDIILPTLLSTLLSTVIGVILVKVFIKRR